MLHAWGMRAHRRDLRTRQARRKLQDPSIISAEPRKENLRHVLLVFFVIGATLTGKTVRMEQELQSCVVCVCVCV